MDGTTHVDLEELLGIAVDLARRAAEIHREATAAGPIRREQKSTRSDVVTAVDREAEQVIVSGIAQARPFDAILGEEGANREGTSGVRWVIDPLDGTTNYVYGRSEYCVSIGIQVDGASAVGVVLRSATGELYTGVRGRGAWLDGSSIRVTGAADLDLALVATGFAYDAGLRRRQAEILAQVLPRIRDIRRGGSAALDLCGVARGVVDAYVECPVAPWDVAAGALIAKEAGARVVVGSPPAFPGLRGLLAATPLVFDPMLELLREAGLDLTAAAADPV